MPIDPPAYEDDPYRIELATTVVASDENDGRPFVVLDDTVFYPEGGGQPGDRGSLNGIEVVEVRREAGRVRHYLASLVAAGPAVPAKLTLDWQRRYDHMQQHTAQHLLSAIALESFGWPTTSFHLGERRCDIELDTPSIDLESLGVLEERVMREVRATRPVGARRISADEYRALDIRSRGLPSDHEGDVRLVEIAGIDVTTCGGTHLRSTAEIESMRLGPTEPMRGGTRLFWLAGGRVRRRLGKLEEQASGMRRLFGVSEDELIADASSKLLALKDAAKALRRLSGELAEAHAATLAASPQRFVEAHFEGTDGAFLKTLARHLVARAPDKTALLTASGDKGHTFLIASGAEAGISLPEVGAEVAAALGGRGGGSKTTYQGKVESLERRDAAVALLGSLVAG